jgi:hypothetical protein
LNTLSIGEKLFGIELLVKFDTELESKEPCAIAVSKQENTRPIENRVLIFLKNASHLAHQLTQNKLKVAYLPTLNIRKE